jgi:hypothetical protein
MARLESASGWYFVSLVQVLALVALLFVGTTWVSGHFYANRGILFWLGLVCFSTIWPHMALRADEAGLHLRWFWLTHCIRWAEVSSIDYRAEFLGSRLEIGLEDHIEIGFISLERLGGIESAWLRHRTTAAVTTGAQVLPWWLRRIF